MKKGAYIAGLDIGSSNTRLVLCEQMPDGTLGVINAVQVDSEGLRRGSVIDVDGVSASIRKAREELQKKTGVLVKSAYVAIGEYRLQTHFARGTVAVGRADGRISKEDIVRVVAASEAALPRLQNRETLHTFPSCFAVDGDSEIRDPVDMVGLKLDVETLFLSTFISYFKPLIDSLDAAGITPDDVVVGPLAASHLLLSKKQKEIGVLLLDLGSQTSKVAVWEEDTLRSLEVLPIGSTHVTHDIALGFQISLPLAEEMKKSYGAILDHGIRVLSSFNLDKNFERSFSTKRLQDIISARVSDILELTQKHLKKIGRVGLLPAGVVFTGNGAKLWGITEAARRELKLPSEVAKLPSNVSGRKDLVGDPGWSTALGLCLWGLERETQGSFGGFFHTSLARKVSKFFRSLIP